MRTGHTGSSRPRTLVLSAGAALALVAVIAVAAAQSGGGGSKASSATNAAAGGANVGGGQDAKDGGSAVPRGFDGSKQTASDGPDDPSKLTNRGRPLPLDVTISKTSGLKDGSEIALHVVPKSGSVIYGFEAFLCGGKATFAGDSDIRPTQTGKCVSKKLSPDSDDYKQVPGYPPYQSVDSTFKVGVGTDTFTLRDGRPVTITCGPGHPCQLVLKLQYPNDFGFAAYPLTYG